MQRIAVLGSLVHEDWHDRELIVRLKQHGFRYQELPLAVDVRVGVLHHRSASVRTEIGGWTGSVLNRERLEASVPFQKLVTDSKGFTAAGGNDRAIAFSAPFAGCEVEPNTEDASLGLQVVDPKINIAFCVISIFGDDVGPGAGQKRQGRLTNADIEILETGAVPAQIERIEVINFDMIASVVSFTGPEGGVRLPVKKMTASNKGFSQAELVVSPRRSHTVNYGLGKGSIVCGVRCIGFNHDLGFQPCLIGTVIARVQPIIHEDELAVSLCFVAKPVFRLCAGRLKCDLLSTIAIQSIP